MKTKWIKGLLSLVISSHALTVLAYEPDMAHSQLPTIAVDLYNQCFPEHRMYQSAAMTKRLVQGDSAMDAGYSRGDVPYDDVKAVGVFSLLLRPFNWHFFSPSREAYDQQGLVSYSFVNLWRMLHEGYWSNSTQFDRALFVGGMLHFLEDVTVPAHVVPAYHGPASIVIYGPFSFPAFVDYMSDFFEGSGLKAKIVDKVDAFPVDLNRLTAALRTDPLLCNRVGASSRHSLASFRNSNAKKTLEHLQQEIPGCPNVVWQDFYAMPTGTAYFGRYNIKNNNPLFGNAGILTNRSNTAACNLAENDVRYRDFVFEQHKLAVETDMKALLWGRNNMHCNFSPFFGLSGNNTSLCRSS